MRSGTGVQTVWLVLVVASLLPIVGLVIRFLPLGLQLVIEARNTAILETDRPSAIARMSRLSNVPLYGRWAIYGASSALLLVIVKRQFILIARKVSGWLGHDLRLVVLSVFLIAVFQAHIFLGFWFGGIGGWGFQDSKPNLTGTVADAAAARGSSFTITEHIEGSKIEALMSSVDWQKANRVPGGCWKGTALLLGFEEMNNLGNMKDSDSEATLGRSSSQTQIENYRWLASSYGASGIVFPHSFGYGPNGIDRHSTFMLDAVRHHSWNGLIERLVDVIRFQKWKYPVHTPYNVGDLITDPDYPPSVIEEWLIELCKDKRGVFHRDITLLGRTSAASNN